MELKLRDYQDTISNKAVEILKKYGIVYLAMEVRTGKTITSLAVVQKLGAKNILFLTKKKAISSIIEDYSFFKNDFNLTCINYESLHKAEGEFDLIILDEAHTLGTYPKPNKKVKEIIKKFLKIPKILLSGTPSPESYSQLFHQFFIHGIWGKYKNFYGWANAGYVQIFKTKTSYGFANDYSKADYDKIIADIGHLIIKFTQNQAGFSSAIEEKILYVQMRDITYNLVKLLKKNKVIEGKNGVILADTKVKELQKIHQLYSGTIKLEGGESIIIDTSKGEFIKEKFKGEKIAIFYKYKAEFNLLKQVFGDSLTDDLQIFNNTDKNIALQIVSGREGISLKKAKYLVFLNIDFSAVSYWQARDRLTTKERKNNTVYWIFSKNGIEKEIYKTVLKKKDFTTKIYNQYEKLDLK